MGLFVSDLVESFDKVFQCDMACFCLFVIITYLCNLYLLTAYFYIVKLGCTWIYFILLYPRHLCRGVYSFRLSVSLFVRSYVRSFVRGICVKVLRQSFSSGVYLRNYSSESIHIWTIVTLEGWHSLYDHGPQGPCPGVGPEVSI